MSQDKIDKLENAGFVWSLMDRIHQWAKRLSDKQIEKWGKSFEELKDFQEEHGHCAVPSMLDSDRQNPLCTWIFTQRKCYAEGSLRSKRRRLLQSIPGFVLKDATKHRSERCWDAAFNQLKKKYHAQHGHTYVTQEEDLVLRRWTRKENWNKQNGKMSEDRENSLKSLGFWDPPPPGAQERGAENHDESDDEDEIFRRA